MPTEPHQSLTQSHLRDFEEWLITERGYTSHPLKGDWEALRVQSPAGDGHVMLYRNNRNNKLKASDSEFGDLIRDFYAALFSQADS